MDQSEETHKINNLQEQLSELEMLQSVFCNPGEIQVDIITIADINEYITKKTEILSSELNYIVNLTIENVKVEINIHLPHKYPSIKPDVLIRINLSRIQQNNLNLDLKNYICGLESGEICIFSIITWIQDNISNYFQEQTCTIKKNEIKDKCARFWIYSHHIYNKAKRKEILNLASEYCLTGFCLPGKPGIICIEGYLNDCNSWWSYIRNLTWQKIMCKKEEIEDDTNLDGFKKFNSFEEVVFQSANVKSKHMDMGEFYIYLEKHNCEYIFKELFGVDSKTV